MQGGFNNVLMYDGELDKEDMPHYHLSFQIGNYLFYFDNMQFFITTGAFAIELGTCDDVTASEHLMADDYCVSSL